MTPAKSEAQRKWAFGVKGKVWAEKHHMDNKGQLPVRKEHDPALLKRTKGRLKKVFGGGA